MKFKVLTNKAFLEAIGWLEISRALRASKTLTVPMSEFSGTEFAVMGCDCVIAKTTLAPCAIASEVICTPTTDMASDHYPVLAAFELPQ